MNVKTISDTLAELTMLKFFPADPMARKALVRTVCEMAHSEDEVRWLVRRMLVLFDEWPGPHQMRAVFCSRFAPKDGIDAVADIARFPEGIPPEKALPAPQFKQIARGEKATADPELAAGFGKLLESSTIPNKPLPADVRRAAHRFDKLLQATITAPGDRSEPRAPQAQERVITPADIQEAVEQLHKAKGQ